MDANDLHPADDYSHRFFIWHEWIQANGPLTTENVFDYFSTSMFYDKQSNNQVLRMQTMHTGMPVANEAEELRRFTGIEFALVHAQPPAMFIIQKRDRISPDEVRPLAAYFIMNNRIYQSPDLYTVISNRLLTSLCSLQTSLDILRAHRPDYTPRSGFVWPIADTPVVADSKKREVEAESSKTAASPEPNQKKRQVNEPKKQQDSRLLLNAMRATAAHSTMAYSSNAFALETRTEAANSETPAATPGVGGSRVETPKSVQSAPTPQDAPPPKSASGAGKKKRKRTSLAPPT